MAALGMVTMMEGLVLLEPGWWVRGTTAGRGVTIAIVTRWL